MEKIIVEIDDLLLCVLIFGGFWKDDWRPVALYFLGYLIVSGLNVWKHK